MALAFAEAALLLWLLASMLAHAFGVTVCGMRQGWQCAT